MEHGGVVGDANAEEARPLDSLLAQAVSNPSPLLVDGGGPIVALALHCERNGGGREVIT